MSEPKMIQGLFGMIPEGTTDWLPGIFGPIPMSPPISQTETLNYLRLVDDYLLKMKGKK